MQQLILQHGPPPDTPRQLQPRAQPPEVRPQPDQMGGFECDFVEEPQTLSPNGNAPCVYLPHESLIKLRAVDTVSVVAV